LIAFFAARKPACSALIFLSFSGHGRKNLPSPFVKVFLGFASGARMTLAPPSGFDLFRTFPVNSSPGLHFGIESSSFGFSFLFFSIPG